MGSQETTCPRCALDLRMSGAVRLTNPALGNNRYSSVPRASRRPPEQPTDENAVTRVMPSLAPRPDSSRPDFSGPVPSDPDATMVRPMPQGGRSGRRPGDSRTRPGESGDRPGGSGAGIWRPIQPQDGTGSGGSPEDDATQVLPSAGRPRPQASQPPTAMPTRRRPQPGQKPVTATPAPPRTGGAEAQGDPSLPSAWFRDPEVERNRDMRRQGPLQNPVFTPPPSPESASDDPPGPHSRKPRNRAWMVVFILVLILTFMILGIVVWWMLGGAMTSAGSAPAGSVVGQVWPGSATPGRA